MSGFLLNPNQSGGGGGGTPGGSDGQIQYNNGGSFGGGPIWDDVKNSQGIQVTDPLSALHTAANTGTTIDDVITGSVALVTETVPTAPVGSVSLITQPSAPASGSVSFVDMGSGFFTGNGDVFTYRIYPCLSTPTNYRSEFYLEITNTIPADSDLYNVLVDWSDVVITGETTKYHVERDINGGGYNDYGIYSTLSFTDSGTSAGGAYVGFPSFYSNVPTPAPNPYTSLSATAIDLGSGAFTEVPNTILVQIDSMKTIVSTDYVSGTPSVTSFDDTGTVSYNIEINWGDNGEATNGVYRVSLDGGTSWIYGFTGTNTGPYTINSTSNSSTAEALWGDTYVAPSVVYTITPRGTVASPSGNAVYSSAGSTYTITLPPDSVRYMPKHTFTGLTTGKITTSTFGRNITGTIYDTGYTLWADGSTVTPTSCGFSGTDQNRQYFLHSFALDIYSTTPLTLSTVSGSGSKTVSASGIVYPSGSTNIRVYRRVNSTGDYYYKNITSPTSVFTDDSTDTTWTNATTNYPPSPLSYTGSVHRLDKALTDITKDPHLEIVSTGSGTRYSKISFGIAADNTAAATFNGHIYTRSDTSEFHLVTPTLNLEISLGGTAHTIIGASSVFNNGNSGTGSFRIKSLLDSYLMNTSNAWDTVGFGQQLASDRSTTVQIQPARSGDSALILVGHASQSTSFNIFSVMNSAGQTKLAVNLGGQFLGEAGNSGAPTMSTLTDTNTGIFFPSSDTLAFTTGGVERARFQSLGFSIGLASGITGQLHIKGTSTSSIQSVFEPFTGQTTDQTQWKSVGASSTLASVSVTGVMRSAGGTASLPGQTFETDTNTGFFTTVSDTIGLTLGGTERTRWTATGAWFGSSSATNPTARIHIQAGTATANTAPIKLTSGTVNTTGETGAIEYDGTNMFFVRSGTTRESVFTGNSGATAPATNTIGVVVDYYGTSNTRVLTTPNSWASVVIGGTTYKIPLYS